LGRCIICALVRLKKSTISHSDVIFIEIEWPVIFQYSDRDELIKIYIEIYDIYYLNLSLELENVD